MAYRYTHDPASCQCDRCTAKRLDAVCLPVEGKWNYFLHVTLTPEDMAALGFTAGTAWTDDDVTAALHMILCNRIREARQERSE